jgi:DNA-binding MarR family transcriptional regulator
MTRSERSTAPAPSRDDIAQMTRAVYRDATAIAAGLGEATGMHPTDVTAMRALDLAGEHRPTMGELGAALGLSSAAVTGLVDRLEAQGMARRVPDAADRRRTRVELTDEAHAIGAALLAPVAARIDDATRALTPPERAVVARFLRTLLASGPDAGGDKMS